MQFQVVKLEASLVVSLKCFNVWRNSAEHHMMLCRQIWIFGLIPLILCSVHKECHLPCQSASHWITYIIHQHFFQFCFNFISHFTFCSFYIILSFCCIISSVSQSGSPELLDNRLILIFHPNSKLCVPSFQPSSLKKTDLVQS